MENNDPIKSIFNLLGTTNKPTENRDILLYYIHAYEEAIIRQKEIKEDIKLLKKCFEENSLIEVSAKFIYDPEYNIFEAANIAFQSSQEILKHSPTYNQIKSEIESVFEEMSFCAYENMRDIYEVVDEERIVFTLNNIKERLTVGLSEIQKSVFDQIENFEKNQLEEVILKQEVVKKAPKI